MSSKIDLFNMVEESSKQPETAVSKEELELKLKELCHSMKVNNTAKKEFESKLEAEKKEFKKLVETLGVDFYQDDSVKVSLTAVEKIEFDEEHIIQYLKDNNLNEYIHTKEFFVDAELTMAATQNKIKLEDLAPFCKKTVQSRINIR